MMAAINEPLGRRLRMGLVGGAGSGFIGRVHLAAATLDHRAELVAGAFSSNPETSRRASSEFGISESRAYGDFAELLRDEATLPQDQRIDFVSIATPNHTHYAIAKAAIESGFHVVCDKPMTNSLGQAGELVRLVADTGSVFAVTHAYAGYPLVSQIREMIASGEVGDVIAVRVEYIQGGVWREQPGQPPARAAWKRDPAKTGPSGTLGDIGTHAYHLLRYCTGLLPDSLSCTLGNFHPARPLDDYGHVVFRFPSGALGSLICSQVSHGRLNEVRIEVDGTQASLVWSQQQHDQLVVRRYGQPTQIYEANRRADHLAAAASTRCRLPGGHPEGFLEAFANIYAAAFDQMLAGAGTCRLGPRRPACPDVADGWEGVWFVQQCLASDQAGGAWTPLDAKLLAGGINQT